MKFGVKEILGLENFWAQNVGPKKILDPKSSKVQEIKTPKNCLVKIVSVRAAIFLIWTNDARRNGTWTNVTVTDHIC